MHVMCLFVQGVLYEEISLYEIGVIIVAKCLGFGHHFDRTHEHTFILLAIITYSFSWFSY